MPVTKKEENNPNILSIDIGGTSIKACVLTAKGDLLSDVQEITHPGSCYPGCSIKMY